MDTLYKQLMQIEFEIENENRPLNELLNEAVVSPVLKPADDLVALLSKYDFVRRGQFVWSSSTRENNRNIMRFLKEYSSTFLPKTIMHIDQAKSADHTSPINGYARYYGDQYNEQPLLSVARYGNNSELYNELNNALDLMPKPQPVKEDFKRILVNQRDQRNYAKQVTAHYTLGMMGLEVSNEQVWVRLIPTQQFAQFADRIFMSRIRNVRRSNQRWISIRETAELKEVLGKTWTGDIYRHSEKVFELAEKSKNYVTVGYAPNQPAKAVMNIGSNVDPHWAKAFPKRKDIKITVANALGFQTTVQTSRVRKHPKPEFLFHPALNDIMNMAKAKSYTGESRLMKHQKEAVGLHLSTTIGYLQTCEPGMGKTVIQLAAMRVRSESIENYRGIVLCEANVREQWAEEAAIWFPEATVLNVSGPVDTDRILEALGTTKPVVVLASYTRTLLVHDENINRKERAAELAGMNFKTRLKALTDAPVPTPTIGSLLLDTHWHDISADEAVIVRNNSSKQAAAMWALRMVSDVATALTATPLNKSPDDIARLLAWVRKDPNLFTGKPLAETYDTTTAKGGKDLFDAFGPLIFRRDTSQVKGKMPKGKPDVHVMKPTPAEKALAFAAENELKRCYIELIAAVDEAEKTATKDDLEAVKTVKENLKAANGAWLGGTQLARMATSDATALLGSSSVGAALLAGQGLVEAALASEPTKRTKLIKLASEKVASGKQMLVFTEFVDVAKTLVKALQENGMNAQSFTGQNISTRDQARKDFQDGKIDVLVCTKAAERGLTLHKASTIVHYDLPWTLEKIVQRTGRSIRIGSEHKTVDVIFLILEGTIEERISNRLMELGVSSAMILDTSRGADLKKSETANAMGGLLAVMGRRSDKQHLRSFGEEFLGLTA